MRGLAVALVVSASNGVVEAVRNGLAVTPPMGWVSGWFLWH